MVIKMTKSVFTRYMVVFMIIIIASFSILALVIGSNMSMITMKNKRDMVEQTTKNITLMLGDYCDDSYNEFCAILGDDDSIISNYISHMSHYDKEMVIFIINTAGNILFVDGNTDSFVYHGLDDNVISRVVIGEPINGYDDLDGTFSEPYLYYGEPFSGSGGEVIGVVFACTSARGVNALMVSTVKALVLASLWVLLAALIAVYFLSEKIIGPLKDMSRAAREFASGRFETRVPVIGRDEVAELAVAFNQMAAGLQSLEEMRSGFLANVSHDLKTPMTTIAGFIDAILEGAISPESQREYLERIKGEVLRLSRLVRQLLDLSRIQAGDRKFEFSCFDICEVARQIILSFEQRIDEKKLQVEFECDEERMQVYADMDSIHQILYNLCDNGVKFSREGGVYRIEIRRKEKKIYVSVYNQGQGIPEADLPFVFERFYKSDKSRGLDKSGVGLGLYISKTIVEAHGESISVDSVQNDYCRFEFTLQPCESTKRPPMSLRE